jgi:ABC-type transport system involved in multi-copper enzyme maturation permease subunit
VIELVWKDLVAARWFLALLILFYSLQLAIMSYQVPLFILMTLLCTALLGFGSIGMEDVQNTESLWCSLPVTRREVVLARYLSTCTGLVLGLALSWLIGRLATRILVSASGRESAAQLGLEAYAVLLIVLFLLAALFLPCYFRFGAGKGLMVFSFIGVAALLGIPLLAQLFLMLAGYADRFLDLEVWRGSTGRIDAAARMRLAHWALGIAGGITALALLISAGLSILFYDKRDL